jgi:hypothetical protein
MWGAICAEVRNWLTFVFAGLGALYGGMKMYQEWQASRLQCDFTVEWTDRDGSGLTGWLRLANQSPHRVIVEQIVARRPRAMDISAPTNAADDPGGRVIAYDRVLPVFLSVPSGAAEALPVYVRLPASRAFPRAIKISIRILSRSRVMRYSERTMTARLPAKIRKQIDSMASQGR